MRQMIAHVARDLTVHGRRYQAAAGETIEVHDRDVATLERYGFGSDDGPGDDPPAGDDLEDRNLGELRELAADREIRGRSKMDREELLEALRTDDGQEA